MTTYLIRRLLLMIPTLIGVTMVVFFTVALSPGGIGASLLTREGEMRPEERKAREAYLKKRYDLDKPLIVQYFKWLNKVSPVGVKETGTGFPGPMTVGFKAPDLGESFTRHRPVSDLILEALPVTLMLELASFPIIYAIAIFTGIRAARARGRFVDVGLAYVLIGLYSLPEIWVGVVLIGYLSNKEYFHWFPSNGLHDVLADTMTFLPSWGANGFERGYLLDLIWHLGLPLICLCYGGFAFLSRLTRGSLLETLSQDFVRTATAKGMSERIVLYRHAFRNSLIPLITASAGILPGMVAGSVIIETIFGIPGMGKLAIDAVNARDRELFLSLTLIASFLTLVGYLIADICYAIADPRVSYVD